MITGYMAVQKMGNPNKKLETIICPTCHMELSPYVVNKPSLLTNGKIQRVYTCPNCNSEYLKVD